MSVKSAAIFAVFCVAAFASAQSDYDAGAKAEDAGDYQKAARYYEKACDANHAAACNDLGFLYGEGQGVSQDYKRAAALYKRRAIAANIC